MLRQRALLTRLLPSLLVVALAVAVLVPLPRSASTDLLQMTRLDQKSHKGFAASVAAFARAVVFWTSTIKVLKHAPPVGCAKSLQGERANPTATRRHTPKAIAIFGPSSANAPGAASASVSTRVGN